MKYLSVILITAIFLCTTIFLVSSFQTERNIQQNNIHQIIAVSTIQPDQTYCLNTPFNMIMNIIISKNLDNKQKNIETKEAILGGGCFWCMEALFERIKGIISVQSGYCGGSVPNPSYYQVKSGTTGHYQVIKVIYNPLQISYQKIIQIFLHVHDPTQKDGQGQDIGSQYLSVIFYKNNQEQKIARQQILKYEKQKQKQVYTKVKFQEPFYEAEDYHQDYFDLRGKQNRYCDIIPGKIQKMKKLFKDQCI